MLDIFLTVFGVVAAWALVRDHQQVHNRLHAAWLDGGLGDSVFGPRIGFRWWRFAAGVALGLALSVKWSGLYYIAFFGLTCVFADLGFHFAAAQGYITGTLLAMSRRPCVPCRLTGCFVPMVLAQLVWH